VASGPLLQQQLAVAPVAAVAVAVAVAVHDCIHSKVELVLIVILFVK
jgi:hypothetical protein